MTFVPNIDHDAAEKKPLAQRVPPRSGAASPEPAPDPRPVPEHVGGAESRPVRFAGRGAEAQRSLPDRAEAADDESDRFARSRFRGTDPDAMRAQQAPDPSVINGLLARVGDGQLDAVQSAMRATAYVPDTAPEHDRSSGSAIPRRQPAGELDPSPIPAMFEPEGQAQAVTSPAAGEADSLGMSRTGTVAESWPDPSGYRQSESAFEPRREPAPLRSRDERFPPRHPSQSTQPTAFAPTRTVGGVYVDRPLGTGIADNAPAVFGETPRSDRKHGPVETVSFTDDSAEGIGSGIEDSIRMSLAYRIAYRLLGSQYSARELAHRVVTKVASLHLPESQEDLAIAGGTVAASLAWMHENPQSLGQLRSQDPHFDHRSRLARELARWPESAQAILALRGLADWELERIVAATGAADSEVREITSYWFETDAESVGMLRDLGQWTGGDANRQTAFNEASPLSHLDDVHSSIHAGV